MGKRDCDIKSYKTLTQTSMHDMAVTCINKILSAKVMNQLVDLMEKFFYFEKASKGLQGNFNFLALLVQGVITFDITPS